MFGDSLEELEATDAIGGPSVQSRLHTGKSTSRIPRSEAGQDWPGLDASGGALASLGPPEGLQTSTKHAATLIYASVGSPSVAGMSTNHPGAFRGTQTPPIAPQV